MLNFDPCFRKGCKEFSDMHATRTLWRRALLLGVFMLSRLFSLLGSCLAFYFIRKTSQNDRISGCWLLAFCHMKLGDKLDVSEVVIILKLHSINKRLGFLALCSCFEDKYWCDKPQSKRLSLFTICLYLVKCPKTCKFISHYFLKRGRDVCFQLLVSVQ